MEFWNMQYLHLIVGYHLSSNLTSMNNESQPLKYHSTLTHSALLNTAA